MKTQKQEIRVMKLIWFIKGTAGEYDEESEWTVRAYTDEGLASSNMLQANAEVEACYAELEAKNLTSVVAQDELGLAREIYRKHMNIDRSMDYLYSKPKYWVECCELIEGATS
jgi:hypothetical protein